MTDESANIILWLTLLSLSEQANRDWLTGLYNRRYFEDTLADHMETARRYDRELSLVLFDIDSFKEINDAKGHEAGDAALREFAGLLKSVARKADIICRYGGDEFAVILPETSAENAELFVGRIIEATADGSFSVSGGVAALPETNLIASADTALLARKKESRR